MTSPTTDRRFGLAGNTAIKAPVTVVAVSNITLSGQQTIDGVALLAVNSAGVPDRVLVTGQTSAADNGIYDVGTAAWTRSIDANGPYDIAQGTIVKISRGSIYARTSWQLTTSGAITIGTTALTWLPDAVSTVLSQITIIGTVANNITDVIAVAAIDADVTTVAGIATDVTTVAGIATDVSAVAAVHASVVTVAGISGNVATVAGISANVTTVAGISANVTTVAGISASVITVAGISANVTSVAGNSANINTVAGISGNVTTVAGISGNVTTVAGISTDVTAVAAISTKVVTVADDVTRIDRLAGYTTEIGIVAGGISSVTTLAAQITALSAPDTAVTLLGTETQGFAIDATTDTVALAVKVLDTTTPANNYAGPLYGFLSASSFPTPKLCMQSDGSLKYNPHNEILQSADPSNASWTKVDLTITTGQVGPDGTTTDATLLTVVTSTTTPRIQQQPAVLANMYRRQELVVKAGTAPFIYIERTNNAVTRRAWFNTSTLAWATVDSGLTTVAPSSTKEDGTAWATGWRSLAVYDKGSGGTTDTIRFGLSDTDGGTSCTVGRTATIAQIQSHRGVKRLPYLATTTLSVRSIPYDWTNGIRSVRYSVAAAYKARAGDDVTNATYWTLSNVTAALNATGPHGEPCSTLTATSSNGTVTQAVTSSGTSQIVFAYVRRVTGTGTLSMSIDNGGTYTDITSLVGAAGSTYGLVYIRGALANPTAVFKIGTSGDAFEFALFNCAQREYVPAPAIAALIDFSSSQDVFSVATTTIPLGTSNTVYVDVAVHASALGLPSGGRNRMGYFGAASVAATVDAVSLPTGGMRIEHDTNDGTARDLNVGNLDSGGRLQAQLRVSSGDHSLAYNGNAPYWNHLPGAQTLTSFAFTFGTDLWLRRVLAIPRGVADEADALRLWQLDTTDANINSNLLATAFVSKYGTTASTTINRIPCVEKLYERGDVCGFICAWGLVHSGGYNTEHPQRAMQRIGEFDRSTNIITWLTAATVLYEPSGWASGQAPSVQGYTLLKLTYGPYRGRLVLVYCQQNGTPVAAPADARDLYVRTSDDNGTTWSAATKILDHSVFSGASAGFVCTGENGTAFQLQDGTQAGRIYVSLNGNNQTHCAFWCDDFKSGGNGTGATWTKSTTGVASTSGGFGTLTEPAIAFLPDTSTILMTFRNSGGGINGFATSTDYGVTFGAATQIAGDNASWNVNTGFLQDDPTGKLGLRGRLIYARSTLNGRLGHKVQSANDSLLTFGSNYRLFAPERFVGYCPIRKAFENDTIYFCMAEVEPSTTADLYESMLLVAFRY